MPLDMTLVVNSRGGSWRDYATVSAVLCSEGSELSLGHKPAKRWARSLRSVGTSITLTVTRPKNQVALRRSSIDSDISTSPVLTRTGFPGS